MIGGNKFINALKKRIDAIETGKGKVARVGVIENQHYDEDTPVAYIAAIHEYGSPSNKIPPRPFFRPTIAKKSKSWSSVGASLLKKGTDTEKTLKLIGELAAGDIVETISGLDSPPLALSTKIARNRRAHAPTQSGRKRRPKSVSIKPLVDTGLLIRSISSTVLDGENE
ncbi:MAG: hypothetical protein ACFNUN_03835 [Aggregatibacter sp.]|uniref:hypothetical protein n=1 Tax=Aggregatibacter sp. TaxID=1872413 RepID=UPI00360D65B1